MILTHYLTFKKSNDNQLLVIIIIINQLERNRKREKKNEEHTHFTNITIKKINLIWLEFSSSFYNRIKKNSNWLIDWIDYVYTQFEIKHKPRIFQWTIMMMKTRADWLSLSYFLSCILVSNREKQIYIIFFFVVRCSTDYKLIFKFDYKVWLCFGFYGWGFICWSLMGGGDENEISIYLY